MPIGTIILLGLFAGLTIYVGLPLAFLKNTPQKLKAFLNMVATGVLVFLLYDVISQASEPIGKDLDQIRTAHAGWGLFSLDVVLLFLGVGLGSVGLVYFNRYVFGRLRAGTVAPAVTESVTSPPHRATTHPNAEVQFPSSTRTNLYSKGQFSHGHFRLDSAKRPSAVKLLPLNAHWYQPSAVTAIPPLTTTKAISPSGDLSPHMLALVIAIGIGAHNFAEGLAIGQSAATGAIQLVLVLIIGFGLHNMTEGFGIAGPLTGESVSWKFIALVGLIGGGPTFLGTVIGIVFNSPQAFILFLALAAGAIVFVVAELLGGAKRFKAPEIVMWGLLIGFVLGYLTDLIVTLGGA